MDTPINKLPSISAISELSAVERAAVLDALFEPCVPLHTLSIELLRSKAFTNYDDLVAAIGVQLTELLESSSSSDTVWLDDILRSHPRLGAKKVESAQSQAEQSQLQGEGQEATQLRELNEDYEKKFSGLRYVIFVNGRSRDVIMEDMRKRIASGDVQTERAAAIKAICDIAADRARKLS